ncbi:MAG: serine hydrolase, partial [Bacteroidota bacterium]
ADSIAAAGAIWSNIEDMGVWVKCMLDSARYEGGQLLKTQTWAELFKPQALIPSSEFYPTTQLTHPKWTSYALGWFQHDYQGKALDFHTGSLPGTMAMIGLMHEEGIGYYFLGNLDHAELRHALMYKVFDTFLGEIGDGRDWNKAMLELYDPPSRKNLSPQMKEKKVFTSSLKLEECVGTYSSNIWGEIKVWLTEGNLWMQTQGRTPQRLVAQGGVLFDIMPTEAWQGPQPLVFVSFDDKKVYSLELGPYSFIKQ